MKWAGNRLRFFLSSGFPFRYLVNGWTISTLLISLLILAPTLTLIRGFLKGPGESWSHVLNNLLLEYFGNTLALVFGVGILTIIIGVTLAWIVANYDFPGKRIFEWALILPLAVPTYIMAFTYVGIVDYTGGLKTILGNYYSGIDIMNIPGIIMIMSLTLYPYVYLLVKSSFLYQSVNIIEASRSLGSSQRQTFFNIGLPVSRPAIIGGLSLVIFEVLNDYGAVAYFGIPTFTTGIFRAWFSLGEIQTAIYLSIILLLFVIIMLGIEKYNRRKIAFEFGTSNKKLKPVKVSISTGWMLFGYCSFILLISFIIPVMQLISWSINTSTYYSLDSIYILIMNSLYVSIFAAAITLLIAFLYHFATRNFKSPALKSITRVASLGYAIPGAVIGVGLLIFILPIDKVVSNWLDGNGISLFITGTTLALIFGYVVRFLSVAYNSLDAGFKKLSVSIDSASRSMGISNLRTATKVDAPILKGAFLGGLLLVFVDIVKELPLTLILRPFNFHTLATKTFELASDERVPESAITAVLIILVGLIPIAVINKLTNPVDSK